MYILVCCCSGVLLFDIAVYTGVLLFAAGAVAVETDPRRARRRGDEAVPP